MPTNGRRTFHVAGTCHSRAKPAAPGLAFCLNIFFGSRRMTPPRFALTRCRGTFLAGWSRSYSRHKSCPYLLPRCVFFGSCSSRRIIDYKRAMSVFFGGDDENCVCCPNYVYIFVRGEASFFFGGKGEKESNGIHFCVPIRRLVPCLLASICTLSPLCCQQQSLLCPVNSFLRIQTVDNYPSLYRFPQSNVHFVSTLQKHPTTVPNRTQPISLTGPCDATSPHQVISDFGSRLNISHATPHLLQCDYPTPWARPSALISLSLSC